MKVHEYLKSSGLQATAPVTFNDLAALLDAPAAEEKKTAEPNTPAPPTAP